MAKEVLAALPKIAATGQQLVQVSVDNAKSAGVIFNAAANQGTQEAISTLKEVSAKDLASVGVVVVSTAIDIRDTVKEPAYSIPEKALIISADVVYAGAGTFVFATTFTALAALGPIAAVVNSAAGIVKYGAEAAGSLAKHLRYKKELGAIEENIASLDRAIKFLTEDKERIVNFPDLIKDIKANIFKLKELGPDYEPLQQEFEENLDKLEKSYSTFSHTRKAYGQFLTLAKECEVTLKEHIQNGKSDPKEIEELSKKLATLETELSNNKNLDPDSVKYLTEKCEALRSALAPAIETPENIANLQKAKGSVVTLANGVLRHKKETTIKMANTDPLKLLTELKSAQVYLSKAANEKIRQNRRDGWQNVGKVVACAAVLGLAIGSLFFPPLAIAVTATAVATSVGFLAFTVYKKYKAYKEKKALKEDMAASKSADITNGLDKTDKNELAPQVQKGMDAEVVAAQQVEHEHANDLGKLSAFISEESPEAQPDQPDPSLSAAPKVLPGFDASKEAIKAGSKSTQEEIATPAIGPKNR